MPLYSKCIEPKENTAQPCVVFLHGLLGSIGDWEKIAPAIAKTHPVLLIDLPGHGNSRLITVSESHGFEQTGHLIIEQLESSG